MGDVWYEETCDDRIHLSCEHPIDSSVAIEEAFVELHALVTTDPRRTWLIDAAGINRISSLAIAQLIATVRSVDMAGGRIVMVHAHPFVANVLRTMRIVKVLPLFEDSATAIAHLTSLSQA
jgi:anti-anti-sigma regulatory factor